jgi:hypothetical protein
VKKLSGKYVLYFILNIMEEMFNKLALESGAVDHPYLTALFERGFTKYAQCDA